jgi:hypothetical protein
MESSMLVVRECEGVGVGGREGVELACVSYL